MRVAFDIDDTLIVPCVATGSRYETPNYETIAILKWFQAQGAEIILWSGSGVDWAKTWGEKLNLMPFTVMVKEDVPREHPIDICFDDCKVKLATVNVQVRRRNNGISRKEWNEGERGEDSPPIPPACHIQDCTLGRKHEGDCNA